VVEGDLVLGREEGPAPGDDNPSSSSCRLILFGRTIRFLIDNSRFLASTSGLSFIGGRLVMLLVSTPSPRGVLPSIMGWWWLSNPLLTLSGLSLNCAQLSLAEIAAVEYPGFRGTSTVNNARAGLGVSTF